MRDAVLSNIQQYNMLSSGDRVVVGLSGGADSVCLCHVLWSLRESLSIQLCALHVNHGIRGEEADRDERFCKAFCENLQIPFEAVHIDVPAESRKSGEGLEACGRRLRYDALQKAAGERGKIATAHTANDNAETVLLHLTRGTGLQGLCGILPVRENIIRPLLGMTRKDVEAYCKHENLDFVTDSTNLSTDYARNRVRLEVLPVLETLNPSVVDAFSRMTESVRQDVDFLADYAFQKYKELKTDGAISVSRLLMLPKCVQARVLKQAFCDFGGKDLSAFHLEQLLSVCRNGGRTVLPGKIIARRRADRLEFLKDFPKPAPWEMPLKMPLSEEIVKIPSGVLEIQKLEQKDLQNLHKELLANAVDCAKIKGNLVLRSRRPGDRFESAVRGVGKSLKKWYNESSVAPELRERFAVLACKDKVVWTEALGTAAPFLPDTNTESAYLLTVRSEGENHAE